MQATTHCPEGITSAMLAAWRDGVLSTAEAERIAAHAPECPVCSAELATYDRMDAALRRMGAPEPDGRLWQAVRDSMKGGRRRQLGRAGGRHASRADWERSRRSCYWRWASHRWCTTARC
ncbi:MAG: anti-sigma factor family protein [Ktedonobacterales bacterium]